MPHILDPDRARLLAYRSAAVRRAKARRRRADHLDRRATLLSRQAADLRAAADRDVRDAPALP